MCAQSIHYLFIAYSLPIHHLFIAYSLPIHRLFITYSLPIHCLFMAYSWPIHCLFITYSLTSSFPLHFLFNAYSFPMFLFVGGPLSQEGRVNRNPPRTRTRKTNPLRRVLGHFFHISLSHFHEPRVGTDTVGPGEAIFTITQAKFGGVS